MVKYVVQGLRPYSFDSEKTGDHVEGMTVHCSAEDSDDEKMIGVGVDRFSITNQKLGDVKLEPGMAIEPVYNKYGKIDCIRVL